MYAVVYGCKCVCVISKAGWYVWGKFCAVLLVGDASPTKSQVRWIKSSGSLRSDMEFWSFLQIIVSETVLRKTRSWGFTGLRIINGGGDELCVFARDGWRRYAMVRTTPHQLTRLIRTGFMYIGIGEDGCGVNEEAVLERTLWSFRRKKNVKRLSDRSVTNAYLSFTLCRALCIHAWV